MKRKEGRSNMRDEALTNNERQEDTEGKKGLSRCSTFYYRLSVRADTLILSMCDDKNESFTTLATVRTRWS